MREIYIRKMRYSEAQIKLEREIQEAFVEGETCVEIIHGIGMGQLKQMALEYVRSQDYLRLVDRPEFLHTNPGSTQVEILGIGKEKLRKYIKS